MRARALKAAGVDEENIAMAMADRLMGMAIDDAVGFRKHGPYSLLDIMTWTGAMADTDYLVFKLDQLLLGKLPLHGCIAHIAVDGMQYFALESFEYLHAGNISSMENYLAVAKGAFKVILEPLVHHGYMGVRQYSGAYHVLLTPSLVGKLLYISARMEAWKKRKQRKSR